MPNEAIVKINQGLVSAELDPSLILSTQSPKMLNVTKYGDYIGKRAGRTQYGQLAGAVMGYYHFKIGDTNRFMKFTTTKMGYRTAAGWTDKTGSALTGSIDDYFDACAVYDDGTGTFYTVFTNGKDNIRKFDGSANSSDMSGLTSYKARFVRFYQGYGIYAHVTDGGTRYPFRFICSNTGLPNVVGTGNSRTFNLTKDKNISDIMRVEHFGNYLAFYKSDCIYIAYLGNTTNIFDFDVRVHNVGLRASRALAINKDGSHIFLGYDDVYFWGGTSSLPEGLASRKIRKKLFENTDPKYLKRAIATYDQRLNQVRIYVPTEYYMSTVYVCDLNDGSVTWWEEFREGITAAGVYLRDEITTIDDLTGTIDGLTGTIDDLSGKLTDNLQTTLEGNASGYSFFVNSGTYNDETIAIQSNYETNDSIFSSDGNYLTEERVLKVKLELKGAQTSGDLLKLYYSIDEGVTWTAITSGLNPDGTEWSGFISLSDTWGVYEGHFDVVCSKIRYKFENNEENSTWYLRKMIKCTEEREEK